MLGKYREIGKAIYDMKNPREIRRYYTFLLRALLHNQKMKELISFFEEDSDRKGMFYHKPFQAEQITRAFFYNKSTFAERMKLVKEHFEFFQSKWQAEYFRDICACDGREYVLWDSEYENEPWRAIIAMHNGQRKEGLMSLNLVMGENKGRKNLYQIMFWAAKDKDGHDSIYIGAMQGPNMEGARDIIKKMTKYCHGYRTKNLILYMLQAAARTMGIEKIYAVTNYGYYANNHVRVDRKLKTSFSDFWEEAGGKPTEDKRFFELPLIESRKTMEEVPTRKRAVYRRRFEFLDSVDAEIEKNVRKMMK